MFDVVEPTLEQNVVLVLLLRKNPCEWRSVPWTQKETSISVLWEERSRRLLGVDLLAFEFDIFWSL